MGFFNNYPAFFETSKTNARPDRLNHRFNVLINNNLEIIKNSRILDLGSHDGRWSFAALKNGASHVTGIEGRSRLVENAEKTMKKYNVPDDNYHFIVDDVFQGIKKLKTGTFDVVFNFGLFYHIQDHMLLLDLIKQLNPKYLILDTNVLITDYPLIKLKVENSGWEGSAISQNSKKTMVLTGVPSIFAVELMLKYSGFDFKYFDWEKSNITNWSGIQDYRISKMKVMPESYDENLKMDLGKIQKTGEQISRLIPVGRITLIAKNKDFILSKK